METRRKGRLCWRQTVVREGLSTKDTSMRSNRLKQSLQAFVLAAESRKWGLRVGVAEACVSTVPILE